MILLPISKDSEWAWFKAQTSTIRCEDTQGLVVYGDTDEVQAMAVFDSFTVDSCTVHWAVANPMVLRNRFLEEIAHHLFVTCGRERIFGLVPSNNEKALKFDLHIGMREVARIPVHGQPIFAIARPDGRQIWVNFARPNNDVVQIIDTQHMKIVRTLHPGKAVLHMEFTPRGEHVWLSARDDDRVTVFDTKTFAPLTILQVTEINHMSSQPYRLGGILTFPCLIDVSNTRYLVTQTKIKVR